MPLIRGLDAHFFEPGDPRVNEFWQVDEGDERLWREVGLMAGDAPKKELFDGFCASGL